MSALVCLFIHCDVKELSHPDHSTWHAGASIMCARQAPKHDTVYKYVCDGITVSSNKILINVIKAKNVGYK